MSGARKKSRGGTRDNRKVRSDDGRTVNGGARSGAGRTPDLAARLRDVRTLLARHQHKFDADALEAARTEAGALVAELAALQAPEQDWSEGKIL